MANYTSTEDLVNVALSLAGEVTNGNSEFEAKALENINRLHHAILAGSNEFEIELGEPWVWAKSQYPGVITLQAPYETGTVSLTNDSTSGTFSSAPAASQAGKYLKITGRDEFFRIATHTAANTAFTLDAVYTGDTGSALSYKAYQFDYTLATGVLRIISPFRVYKGQGEEADNEGMITELTHTSFHKEYPLHRLIDGIPTRFCRVYENTDTGVITVRMNKIVSEMTRAEYDYIPIPSDLTDSSSSIPLVPREHRACLAHGAAYYLLLEKNDSRATDMFTLTQRGLNALVQANRREMIHTGKNVGRLFPRQDRRASKRFVVQNVED